MSEQSIGKIADVTDVNCVRMRIENLLEKTDRIGLTDAVHHHCRNIFSKDLYSVDSAQLTQLETVFGYFFKVLASQSKRGNSVH